MGWKTVAVANFILHLGIRPLAGVDLTLYTDEAYAKEVVRGEPLDPNNIFRWDKVRLNLAGDPKYDLTKPWVSKVRQSDGHIAVDFGTFVDDAHPTGPMKSEAWSAARTIARTLGNWVFRRPTKMEG